MQLGVLFFKEMFADTGAETASLMLLPMLLYHPVQLVTGSVVSPIFNTWVSMAKTMAPLLSA